tara:strand:+ start:417 stop:575 length:159 start_codon:yes stop_codon:yes gene_type:complete
MSNFFEKMNAEICIDEFEANLLVVNNGGQSVFTILNERRLALLSNDEWTAVE